MDVVGAKQFLLDRDAVKIEHPGGTLFAHLCRVGGKLAGWGAGDAVVLAGLCHAVYGTDGFAAALLPTSERARLVEVIGVDAEALVYLYGSCDRDAVYPLIAGVGSVPWRDRFTGAVREVDDAQMRALVDITVANELDVVAHDETFAARYSAPLLQLFSRWRHRLSPPVWAACQLALQPINEQAETIEIAGEPATTPQSG